MVDTVDTLGRARRMLVQQWTWLIGMTDDSDERLLGRARSYAQPPDVSVTGGAYEGWKADRRAHRIAVSESTVTIRVDPRVPCVNPVFELANVPGKLSVAKLGERLLGRGDYAWDGRTLWLAVDVARLSESFERSTIRPGISPLLPWRASITSAPSPPRPRERVPCRRRVVRDSLGTADR